MEGSHNTHTTTPGSESPWVVENQPKALLAARVRADLLRLADGLDRRALAAADAAGVFGESEPAARQAVSLLTRAARGRLFSAPDASGRDDRNSEYDQWIARLRRREARDGPDTPAIVDAVRDSSIPLYPADTPDVYAGVDDDLALWQWDIVPFLRVWCVGHFLPDRGEYDVPPLTEQGEAYLQACRRAAVAAERDVLDCYTVAYPYLDPLVDYTPATALTHARAQARTWAEAMRAASHLIGEVGPPEPRPSAGLEVDPEYAWVKWPSGATFHFPEAMRPVVRRCCGDYLAGKPSTGGNELLRLSNGQPLDKLFKVRVNGKLRNHPAWGTMIIPVPAPGARGRYAVRDPGADTSRR